MPLYYLIILCLFFHFDSQLCNPWPDFLSQMIEIRVGKDLLGHFTLTPASDSVVSKLDEAPTPSFGRLVSTIQLIHTANSFSLTFNSQLTALFFLIQLIICLLFSDFNPLIISFSNFFLKFSFYFIFLLLESFLFI